ncbi:hypothetical protein ACLK1Y_16310 [Escherichia coli]
MVKAREAQGQRLPALFCFPQILQHRLRSINAAFKRAREPTAITATTPWFTQLRLTSIAAMIESRSTPGTAGAGSRFKAGSMAVRAHAVLPERDRLNGRKTANTSPGAGRREDAPQGLSGHRKDV